MINPATTLTQRQKNLCEYGGTFGVLLTATCLIQHLRFAIPSYFTNPMIPAYLFAIAAFVLLGLQKTYAFILLIVSGCFSAVTEYVWITHHSFSFVVLLLFIYHVVMLLALHAEDIPRTLKRKRDAEKAEENNWAGKL